MPPDPFDTRLAELFDQALDIPAGQREAWARSAAADDPALLERLLALLRADADDHDPVGAAVRAGMSRLESDAGPLGKRLGPWQVVDIIGEGGMGTVFLAERADREYRKRVAIKLIRGFPDADRLARMRTERQILADLDHPNIAQLIDGGSTDDGQPWLAMEYIDGMPIDQWCATRMLSARQRGELMIQVARAVHFAHQHLVIHRDIKPGNVLVTAEGVPKLLDFGIAKLTDAAEGSDAAVHATRLRYYTPGYSSPEQIEGKAISTASDVFSLGKLLDTVLRAGAENLPLTREPAAIVRRATAAEPPDRYPSASALATDLQRWLDGHAVEALARRRGYRLWRFMVRHRLAVTGVALALAITGLLVAQVVVERRDARLAAARAEQTLTFLTGLIESARPEFALGDEVTVAEVLERGQAQLERDTTAPDLGASIALTLASAWHALDEFPHAGELYRQAAGLAARAGDRNTELRARAKALVVDTRAGRVKEISAQADQVLADIQSRNTADPALRADVLNDWAVWANEAGRAAHARDVLQEVVELRTELGDEAALAAAENNLALAEDRLGNVAAALALAEQSLARKQRVLGPEHPSTLIGLHVTAVAARRMGEFARADQLLDELLARRIEQLGADNPVLADDYNERANAVHDAGDFARAIELYREALALDARLDEQPNRHILLNNLAAAHEDRGDFAAAEPHLLESITLREQRYGADHASTLRARHNLARLRLRQQRLDEARSLATANLAEYRLSLGPEHRDTRNAALLSAWIDWQAAPVATRTPDPLIAAAEAVLSDSPATSLRGLATRSVLARALVDAGHLTDAREQLQALIDDYRTTFGPEHPKAAELELELARIERTEGRPEAAAERIARAAPILEQALTPGAPALTLLECLRRPGHGSCG